ncbi:collagen triple helix repeat-containing protein 1-like [Oscarella lobularis]|uniref:collagen triple helix repeat-containing protein 1-like n=1 Tax=Oscarella lobularis TaxID=121494 RepID=UPI0033140C19
MTTKFSIYLLIAFYVFVLLSLTRAQDSDNSKSSLLGAGIPGIPGQHGLPGRDGRDGVDGVKGERGIKGDGGAKGDIGLAGNNGHDGIHGKTGQKGIKGDSGAKGEVGLPEPVGELNWKHCVWYSNSGLNAGLLKACNFVKKSHATAIRVLYQGTLRTYCSSGQCCNRWYFTFNGNECGNPATIEGIKYGVPAKDNPNRVTQIEGHCERLPAGTIAVGIHVGKCVRDPRDQHDANSGWNAMSRIIIEELPPPQS